MDRPNNNCAIVYLGIYRIAVFVVFDPVKWCRIAYNRLLELVQRRIDHIRLAGFNFSICLALGAMLYGQHCNGVGMLQA